VKRIVELLESNNFRDSVGQKARTYTINNYGWNAVANKYIKAMDISIT